MTQDDGPARATTNVGRGGEKHRRLINWQGTRSLAEVCNLPALIRAADFLGLPLEEPPDSDDRPPDLSVIPDEFGFLLSVGPTSLRTADISQLVHYLVATIPWTFFNLSPQPILHASGCVVDGRAVLFCGVSGMGKSSLAAAAWEAGLPVINDDCTAVDPGRAMVQVFPQGISLRLAGPEIPASLAGLIGYSDHYSLGTGWKADHWLMLGRPLQGLVPYGVRLPVKALYLIRRGETSRRLPAERRLVLETVLAQTFPGQAGRLAMLPFVEALWQHGSIFELEVGEGDVHGALALAISARS